MLPRAPSLLVALALTLALCGCGDGNRTGKNAGRIDAACTSNAECDATELCATGLCEGGLGTCRPRPLDCLDTDNDPVCGCDGRTYQTECFASLEGVRLAQLGACPCRDNSECDLDQYCALDNSCVNPGLCRPRPETCEPVSELVCGCDFTTYESPCEAASAGVRVSAIGECECESNEDCASDEFCDAEVCDGPGVCALRNDPACDSEEVVTGCDGVLYASVCAASQAGVRDRPD